MYRCSPIMGPRASDFLWRRPRQHDPNRSWHRSRVDRPSETPIARSLRRHHATARRLIPSSAALHCHNRRLTAAAAARCRSRCNSGHREHRLFCSAIILSTTLTAASRYIRRHVIRSGRLRRRSYRICLEDDLSSAANGRWRPAAAYCGQITSLSDIGKPMTIARLLAARRDGDPQQAQFARSEVRDVVKDGDNTLSFTLLTLATSATSMTTAMPRVRKTQARTMFVGGSTPYLVTAWASSASPGASCVETDCPPCTQLRCGCPPPKCEDTTGPDPVDLAIVGSLRVA